MYARQILCIQGKITQTVYFTLFACFYFNVCLSIVSLVDDVHSVLHVLTFSENSLVVSDSLQGKFKYAKSRFYFHPDLITSLEDNLLIIEGEEFILHSDLKGKFASLVDSFWHPEFGLEVPNKMLMLEFDKNQLDIEFTWSKN